jgi:homoserine/homoserine lactone efflux protein
MSLWTWLLFVVTETSLCLTPGPAVLFVLSQGIAHGGAASIWANAGILSGNTFYFVLSALGLGAVLASSRDLYVALTYIGAAYLVFLGIRTMMGSGVALTPSAPAGSRGPRVMARGFALQVSNPKALLFFAALLPQFVTPAGSVLLQILVLGVTSLAIEFVVLAGYGYLAGLLAETAARPRVGRALNIVSGTLLVVAAAGVLISSR